MTGQELFEHVRELADDLDTVVWVCGNCGDAVSAMEATTQGSAVFLATIPDTPTPYLVALHELGHAAKLHGYSRVTKVDGTVIRPTSTRLAREAEAWRWALENSLIEPGPEEWAQILWRLRTYDRDRRYKRDPDFDSLLREAERKAADATE